MNIRNKKILLGIFITVSFVCSAPLKAFWGSLYSQQTLTAAYNTVKESIQQNKGTALLAGTAFSKNSYTADK